MKLTPDEQIYMVNGQSIFCMCELPDKHIPRIQMLDGGTGLNYEQLFGDMLTKANLLEIINCITMIPYIFATLVNFIKLIIPAVLAVCCLFGMLSMVYIFWWFSELGKGMGSHDKKRELFCTAA